MTALACLRVMIDPDRAQVGGDTLADLVSKVAGAFLETRWTWPRRYGEIAPYAFLLADPKATRLEPTELVALSEALHLKLFGASGPGGVSLALLEGEQNAVTRFAAVDPAILRRILSQGGTIEGVPGLFTEISPEGVRVVSPEHEAGPLTPVPAVARRTAPAEDDGVQASYSAVWYAPKTTFVGNGLVAQRKTAKTSYSTFDGPAFLPGGDAPEFDLVSLGAAPAALAGSQGLLFLPICFSSSVHRPTRERYLDVLEGLPQKDRPRLAATVYEVPRAPNFTAIAQLKAFLAPYFSFIDLQTADPEFQIDAMTISAVNSVTLCLPDTDENNRLSAAARFLTQRDTYQRRRIWPAISNVRTRRELDFCMKLRTPFLSGRAIGHQLAAAVDPVFCAADQLPLREAGLAPAPRRAAGI